MMYEQMDAMTLAVLTDAQREAVEYVTEMSKKESMKVYRNLRDRAISLGVTEEDLTKCVCACVEYIYGCWGGGGGGGGGGEHFLNN